MPAYARGQGATPSVPLLGAEASEAGDEGGAVAQGFVETAKEPGAQASVEQAEQARDAQGEEARQAPEREPEQKPQAERATTGEETEGEQTPASVESVSEVAETGEEEEVEAHARSLRLQGLTRARFSNSFRTLDVVTEPGEGCSGCRGRGCVHVTGTLESTFNVSTTVTLPRMPRNLTPCQRTRVQDAINNVLAPHEQQHVDAFNTYNGTTSTPFDMTICRSAFNARIRAMHRAAERARRAAAKALSAALDPFNFDVDLDCEEEVSANEPEHTTAGAENPQETA
jgi:hypothetical protein